MSGSMNDPRPNGPRPNDPRPDAAPSSGPPSEKDIERALLAELDDLVGLDSVKTEVRLVTNLLRVQQLRAAQRAPGPQRERHGQRDDHQGERQTHRWDASGARVDASMTAINPRATLGA